MTTQRITGRFLRQTALLLLATLLATGCSVSKIAANRIITAPNLYNEKANKKWAAAWAQSFEKLNATNPFTPLSINVGPPDARLAGLVLQPSNCRLDVTSEIKAVKGGTNLNIEVIPRTNCYAGPIKGNIVLLHGYRTSKEFMSPWAFLLANAGYRVILVDVRGHGESTGKIFSGGKYETADLVQVLDYLTSNGMCDGRMGVLGYSFGADLALNWAAHDPRVATVVAIAPYDQPNEAFLRLAEATKYPLRRKTLKEAVTIAATKLDLRWADWSGTAALTKMANPALLIGGERDLVSPPSDLKTLQGVAPKGSECVMIPEADHVSVGYAFPMLREPVLAWFKQHLDMPQLAR